MTPDRANESWTATLIAAGVGLLGAVLIWIATPYSNFILGSANISDSYLPVAVMFMTLLLVMGVNPLLDRLRPGWALTTSQLAVAIGIMLIACVLPGGGLLRVLPFSLAKAPQDVSANPFLAREYERMDLPPGLFPDPIGFRAETPAGDGFLSELPAGEAIPWGAWMPPLLTWGALLLFCWMMMIGLAMIVMPQWRHNERLAFPLLTVQQALIEKPQPGRRLPPLLGQRSFWIALATVFVLHLLTGLKVYYPESVPAIPLRWDLTPLFTEDPFRHVSGYIRMSRVYFLFVGVAFFMPRRISFSIWFFLVVYAFWRSFAHVYGILDYIDKMDDHRFGAVIVLTIAALWVGRSQWARVFASLFRRPVDDTDRRNRRSGLLFLTGLAGMFAWMVWAGVQPGWALALVGFGFMMSLLIARVVAETGMPFIRLYENPLVLMRIAPISWLSPVTVYMTSVVHFLFSVSSRVNATAIAVHSLGLDEQAGPRRQARFGTTLIGCLAVGLIIAGAAHLIANYRHSLTLDGRPLNEGRVSELDSANTSIQELGRGQLSAPAYNRYLHLGFGASLAAVLYYLCLAFPQWPLHPFGMMLIDSYAGHEVYASVFFGWLLQVLVVRFGGAGLYRRARPVFLGLIVGDVIAAIFWAIVPVVLVALGLPYQRVHILPP